MQFEDANISKNSFKILEILGFWRPRSFTSFWKICIYNFYSAVSFILEYFFASTFFINLYQNRHIPEVYVESFFFFTTVLMVTLKLTYINIHRENIISLINTLLQKNCLPRNDKETAIYNKFKENHRFSERIFMTTTFCTAIIYMLYPLKDRENLSLPLKSWVPFAVDSGTIFWTTYAYQFCSVCLVCILYTTTESLLAILMQSICTQLEFFNIRLLEITNIRKTKYIKMDICQEECDIIKDCVDHHICIFSMGNQLNDIFGNLVFLQFFVSVTNICTCGFRLTKMNASAAYFWFTFMIISCFIFQIFIHCYFGEEMTTKSLSVADKIYLMDWNLLSSQTKQKLIIIMMRSRCPMQLSGASVIVLSIETFFKVLKASYSSYSLLRNSN